MAVGPLNSHDDRCPLSNKPRDPESYQGKPWNALTGDLGQSEQTWRTGDDAVVLVVLLPRTIVDTPFLPGCPTPSAPLILIELRLHPSISTPSTCVLLQKPCAKPAFRSLCPYPLLTADTISATLLNGGHDQKMYALFYVLNSASVIYFLTGVS